MQNRWYDYFDYGETTLCHLILTVLICIRTFYISRVFISLAKIVVVIWQTCVDTSANIILLVVWLNLMVFLQKVVGNSYEDDGIEEAKYPYFKAVILNLKQSVGDIQVPKIT